LSAGLFSSCQVWLIWTYHFMLVRSQIRLFKIHRNILLTLYFHVTITTNTFESLSTWRWIIPCFLIKSILIYMPHILAWKASQEPNFTGKTTQSSFSRLLPTNENNMPLLRPTIQMSLLAYINFHCYLENQISWVVGTLKIIFK
jgi:hypothetical protein